MSIDILKQIADEFPKIDQNIKDTESLIKALDEAGEPTASLKAELSALKIRRDKWRAMLRSRGLLK